MLSERERDIKSYMIQFVQIVQKRHIYRNSIFQWLRRVRIYGGMERTTNVYRVSSGGDENVLKLITVMVA